MKSHHWIGAAASALLGSVLVVGSLTIPTSAAMAQTSGAVVRGLPDFTELVEQVGPSVVNIRTLEKARPSAAASGGPEDEMQELFRRLGLGA